MARKRSKSDTAGKFLHYWETMQLGFPGVTPEPEYEINNTFFDWAFLYYRLLIEIDGGTTGFWITKKDGTRMRRVGDHSYGAGYVANAEKRNHAIEAGWVYLYYTPEMLDRDPVGCIEQVRSVLLRLGFAPTT